MHSGWVMALNLDHNSTRRPPKREKERVKMVRERGKHREILGSPPFWPPPFLLPPSRAPTFSRPSGPHSLEPHTSGSHSIWLPTLQRSQFFQVWALSPFCSHPSGSVFVGIAGQDGASPGTPRSPGSPRVVPQWHLTRSSSRSCCPKSRSIRPLRGAKGQLLQLFTLNGTKARAKKSID